MAWYSRDRSSFRSSAKRSRVISVSSTAVFSFGTKSSPDSVGSSLQRSQKTLALLLVVRSLSDLTVGLLGGECQMPAVHGLATPLRAAFIRESIYPRGQTSDYSIACTGPFLAGRCQKKRAERGTTQIAIASLPKMSSRLFVILTCFHGRFPNLRGIG